MPTPGILLAPLLVATLATAQETSRQGPEPVAWWSLDEVVDEGIGDRASQTTDRLEGHHRLVDGVTGKALVFDGYTTVLRRPAASAPKLASAFTIEGWVAVGAYPWNVVPIVDHGDERMRGFVFGLGPRGELSLRVAADGRWLEATSADGAVPLRKWSHLAARHDAASGVALFVDGRLVTPPATPDGAGPSGRRPLRRRVVPPRDLDLLVGAVRAPLRPVPWHRYEGTRPSWYSLDGVLDELKIYDVARSDAEIAQAAGAVTPGPPPLAPRVLPSGPNGPGRFGAYLTKLSYYPEWDALWRVGPHPDVLVRFDRSPVRVVFWRGTQYSPAWVTDNGLWMADQSVEGYDRDFTYEHMNDKQNRYSHVRVIEQSDARAVVHWRYALVSVKDEIWNTQERLGNGAWVDEYYYFYPDATGVRKVTWSRDTLGHPIQYQESIPLTQPGQLQGDVVHPDYVTVGNLAGETQVFSYVEDPKPDSKPVPADLVVQMHNLKSRYKPFIVFEPGNRMSYLRDMNLANLSRPGSGNHWPVGQVLSDGRTSLAADRASHFLGFPISQPPLNRGEDGRDHRCSLYGMTDRPFPELVELARSWSLAPELRVVQGGFTSLGYDRSERAYRLARSEGASPSVELSLAASPTSPLRNLALVVENWGEGGASLTLDGRAVPRGATFRYGHRPHLDGTDLVVWIEARGDAPVRLALGPER
ncbi:MAG TPA: LamG domain-containing protein [Vicinamibacteria bacterium]|nr:LamG domain-containing protein [Vicinamibacteria bacterium]